MFQLYLNFSVFEHNIWSYNLERKEEAKWKLSLLIPESLPFLNLLIRVMRLHENYVRYFPIVLKESLCFLNFNLLNDLNMALKFLRACLSTGLALISYLCIKILANFWAQFRRLHICPS